MSDFTVTGGGTLYVLTPLTLAAQCWIDEHIESNAQRFGNGVAVEHRYIGDIVAGIERDGLTASY